MAGEGIKLFLSGDILTASDINGYLMDQVVSVFADSAERDAAFGDGIPVANGGSGKPLLTNGRLCYLLDIEEVQFYNGSTWQSSSQFAIEDGGVTEVKLAANAVTAGKIASGAVTETKIGTGAVTEGKLGSGAVTETKIGTGAVTSDKIADGAIVNADINASAAIADTKLDTIATADKVSLSALNIDGGTDIGAALTNSDLFVVDDGGAGTNRKAAASRISDFVFNKVSGDITINSSGVATLGVAQLVTAVGSSNVATAQTISGSSYAAVSTAQDITLTTGTSALILMSFQFTRPTAPETGVYMSFAVSGATTRAASDVEAAYADTYGNSQTVVTKMIRITDLNAGSNTFSARFRWTITPGSGVNVYNRSFTVIAI